MILYRWLFCESMCYFSLIFSTTQIKYRLWLGLRTCTIVMVNFCLRLCVIHKFAICHHISEYDCELWFSRYLWGSQFLLFVILLEFLLRLECLICGLCTPWGLFEDLKKGTLWFTHTRDLDLSTLSNVISPFFSLSLLNWSLF